MAVGGALVLAGAAVAYNCSCAIIKTKILSLFEMLADYQQWCEFVVQLRRLIKLRIFTKKVWITLKRVL